MTISPLELHRDTQGADGQYKVVYSVADGNVLPFEVTFDFTNSVEQHRVRSALLAQHQVRPRQPVLRAAPLGRGKAKFPFKIPLCCRQRLSHTVFLPKN